MKVIKSKYVFQELFSFIPLKRKFKIIKYNSFLHNKLDLSIIDYKQFFFQLKIEEYNYPNINSYWIKFKNDLNDIIDGNSYKLFINCLSNKKDFILKLNDKDFNIMMNNSNYKDNILIEIKEMEIIPKILLIKDNKLTNKIKKIFKEIFDLYSSNGKMSKSQLIEFMNKIERNDDENINKLYSYDIDKDGYLLIEDFIKYYYDLIKYNIDIVWEDLNNLEYNNFLEKNKIYDLEYLHNHLNEFEEKNILSNYFQIINERIKNICLFSKIDKIFIDYLNIKKILINLKQIEISIINLKIFIELNIICPNIEELSLYINDNFDLNKKEIMNIFNNIKIFNIYIKNKFDLIDLMSEIKDSKIENLKIFDKINKYEKNDSKIILNNIKKIIIDGNNDILFNNIQFPNLEEYELNLCNINENIIIESNDFNSINILFFNILFLIII